VPGPLGVGHQVGFQAIHDQFKPGPLGSGGDQHVRFGGRELYAHPTLRLHGRGAEAAVKRALKHEQGALQVRQALARDFGPAVTDRILAKVGRDVGRDLGQGITRSDLTRIKREADNVTKADRDAHYGRLTGHDMSAARFVPVNEVGVDAGFASGAMSSVDKIRYRDGTVGVFKAERRDGPMPHAPGRNTGIPERLADANMSGRAVATSKLDQALDLGLVPRTEFAVNGGRAGCVQEFVPGGKLFEERPVRTDIAGSVNFMQAILGKPGVDRWGHGTDEIGARTLAQVADARPEVRERAIAELMEGGHLWATKEETVGLGRVDLSAPTVQKSLADAHVMDLLTGQVDRNPGNFIFETGVDGHVRAKLIDNDLSFGAGLTELSHEKLQAVGSPLMLDRMPRLIDADTARRVLAMTPDALRAALADTGLSDDEINAATERLDQLQGHIGLVSQGQVPGGRLVDNWDATTFREQLAQPDNYVRRSIEDQSENVLGSSRKTAVLVEDVRANGARGLASLAAMWSPDKTGGILKADIRAGGELVKALLAEQPRALTELLIKLSPEDRGAVLGGLPAEAAAELVRVGARIATPPEEPPNH
jgi:hypothetical protein